jgi:hypothetical protein
MFIVILFVSIVGPSPLGRDLFMRRFYFTFQYLRYIWDAGLIRKTHLKKFLSFKQVQEVHA